MLLSAVSSFFSKLILTNNDGHFECFSLKNENIRTYLESRGITMDLAQKNNNLTGISSGLLLDGVTLDGSWMGQAAVIKLAG
jgi:hypothetical protein